MKVIWIVDHSVDAAASLRQTLFEKLETHQSSAIKGYLTASIYLDVIFSDGGPSEKPGEGLGCPGLIAIDTKYSDGKGVDLITRIRSHESMKDVKMVVHTYKGSSAEVAECVRAGADAVFRRPNAKAFAPEIVDYIMKNCPG